MARFENIESGRDRRVAQALLNNYNSRIAAWQRQADELPNRHAVRLQDYVGFSADELDEFYDSDELRFAIENRLADIDERVELQRDRMRARNREQSRRANERRIRSGKRGRSRGRPSEGLLNYGQYVYFAVGYNHGMGAGFHGYGAAEASTAWEPTHISEWDEV